MSKRRRDDVQCERKSTAPRRNRMTTRLNERKRTAAEAIQNPRSKTRIKTECTQEQKKPPTPPTMSEREKRALAAERRALIAAGRADVAEDHIAASDPTKIFDANVRWLREGRVRWLHKEKKRIEDLRKRQKHIEDCRKRARAYEERIKHQKAIDNLRDLLGGMTLGNPPKTKHVNTPLRF